LTWQASERERGGESGSKKEMSHPRWTLAGNCVFNNGQSLPSIVRRDEEDRKAKFERTEPRLRGNREDREELL
jgi:hypothetical protein